MSEREAACHRPQQPCWRRERPLASKSVGFGIEILGCLPRPTVWRRIGPGAPAGRRVLPPPLSAPSLLGLAPPPQSLSFPVAKAFTQALLPLPDATTAYSFQLGLSSPLPQPDQPP